MSSLQWMLMGLSGVLVLSSLFIGTFLFLFLERLVYARIQHREGPGRHGTIDGFQVWKDFLKSRGKSAGGLPGLTRFRAAVWVWTMLPCLFLLVLMGAVFPASMAPAELPILLVLPLAAVAIEGVFLYATLDHRERFEWRKRLVPRMMGASVLALSFLAISLQVGHPTLNLISGAQTHFPYHSLFSTPGLFLSAVAALGGIFLFANEGTTELSLNRSLHYRIFFVRRMWIFCLLCFWIFVFAGGVTGVAAKALFPLKLLLALFVFALVQGGLPGMKSSDSEELALRWLFRLCLLGLVIEAVWVGVLG